MPDERRTIACLWAGVAAPVVFTTVYLIEGATRLGYDPLRHQVSLLSLGDRGWVQILNFLVTGALLLVFAIGLRGWLWGGPGGHVAPGAVAIAGLGLLLAGLFPTQPLFGYPPGTPQGMARDITPGSVVHVLGAILFFFGLIVAAVAFAVRSWREGSTGWAIASAGAAVVIFVCFGASGGGPSGELLFPDITGLLQRIALLAGFGWVLAVALWAIGSLRAEL
jgi:uncharacterized protein DUF998